MKKEDKRIIISIIILVLLLVVGVIISNRHTSLNHLKTENCTKGICEFNKNTIELKEKEEDQKAVILNGKEVFNAFSDLPLDKDIYTFDETILFSFTKPIYNKYKVIEIIDTKGNETVISQLPIKGMSIQDYKVNDTEIIITGSRFSQKEHIWLGGGRENDKDISICDEYKANKDEVVTAKYKMTYLGNNKFSELEKIEETTLENYKEFPNPCNNN